MNNESESAEKLYYYYIKKVQKYLESEWEWGCIQWLRAANDSLFTDEARKCFKLNESVNNCACILAMSRLDGPDRWGSVD